VLFWQLFWRADLGRKTPTSWWAARRIWAVPFRQVVLVVEYSFHGLPISAHNSPPRTYPLGASWADVEQEVLLMIKRLESRKVAGVSSSVVEVCNLALQLPTVFEYLTATAYADGTARRTSSLLLFNDAGTLKAMLRDQDAGLCCWVGGQSLEAVLAALEAALLDPDHEWRVDRQNPGQKATRVKK